MSIIPNPADVPNGDQKASSATAKCNQNCEGCLCKKYSLRFHFTDQDGASIINAKYIAYFSDGGVHQGTTDKKGFTEVFFRHAQEKISVHLDI